MLTPLLELTGGLSPAGDLARPPLPEIGSGGI